MCPFSGELSVALVIASRANRKHLRLDREQMTLQHG
jgi:hypothetical protein